MAIIFLPSLMKLLTEAEWQKGAPLSGKEVEKICDMTIKVGVPDNIASALDPSYKFGDSDPQKCWQAWLNYRAASPGKRPEEY